MGRATKEKRDVNHRQQLAARRAAAERAQLRTRLLLVGGAIIAVVAVVLALVLVKAGSKSATAPPPADGPTGAALAAAVRDLTDIPASTLDAIGAGSLSRPVQHACERNRRLRQLPHRRHLQPDRKSVGWRMHRGRASAGAPAQVAEYSRSNEDSRHEIRQDLILET
jgi:hypothetical protein